MSNALDLASRRPPYRVKGWHVGVAVVAFFGVVIGVDAAFVTMALRTYPGEVSSTPYEDGVAFNRRLAQEAAQAKLGWEASVAADPGSVRLQMADANGAALSGLAVTGRLSRPATEAGAETIRFKEVSSGVYVGPFSRTGAWDLVVHAVDSRGSSFEAQRRLTWP
jgi:nitrogen fixation protein FixH